MGWTMTKGQTREQLIARRIETQDFDSYYEPGKHIHVETLHHKAVNEGNGEWTLWTVRETTVTVIATGEIERNKERWIGCDLLRNDRGYGWGYKDMEESMGPYYCTCPLEYFDLVPLKTDDHSCALEFRNRCRAAHGLAPLAQRELFNAAG